MFPLLSFSPCVSYRELLFMYLPALILLPLAEIILPVCKLGFPITVYGLVDFWQFSSPSNLVRIEL